MASISPWSPHGPALTITAIAGTVTRTSAKKFTVVINASWEVYYSTNNTTYGMDVTSGGVTKTLSSYNSSGNKRGSGSLTGTYDISGNGSAKKEIKVTFRNYDHDNDPSASTDIKLEVTVPAWTSYTVQYNANGGSGAPGKQTKWKDQTLTLSSTKPTRTGHSFSNWNTKSDGSGTSYSSGGSYTANSGTTLYAIWTANTYQVTFNANGGTGAPVAQTKTYGKTLTLSSTKPTRTNYNFKGWGTSASATTASYQAGGSYTSNAPLALYAVWELAYKKPRINGFSVKRCGSGGAVSNEGTYALVAFTWGCDKANPTITIECIGNGGVVNTKTLNSSSNPAVSGTSGSVSVVVGNGDLDAQLTYTIHLTVEDSNGSYDRSLTLNGSRFPIDALRGGNGVAFGKSAEADGYADFAYEVVLNNNLRIAARDLEGNIVEAFQPINSNGNTVIGWGNYNKGSGNTNVYGHDVNIGVSNLPNPSTYRPYYRPGDVITTRIRTSGYVTNAKKEIYFVIPIGKPVVGVSSVAISTGSNFLLRQNGVYTHGSYVTSEETVRATPGGYKAWVNSGHTGISVVATFSDLTNATNNDAIGVDWDGTITFS